MSNMNPSIRTIQVGTKSMREVVVYPLSMSDQFKMTDIIVHVMKNFSDFEGKADIEVVETCVELIKTNLTSILELILDEGESISFDELTNDQFTALVELIFEVNYEGMLGNFQSLKTRVLRLFQPKAEKKVPAKKKSK